MNRETVERYDASRETPGHWEVSYLLPQLLPGSQYPVHDVNAALLGVLQRLFAALRASRIVPPVKLSLTPCRSHRHA